MLALATPQAAALYGEEMTVWPLMEIASVVQTAITLVTAVKMSTALHVMLQHYVHLHALISVFICM